MHILNSDRSFAVFGNNLNACAAIKNTTNKGKYINSSVESAVAIVINI